MTETKLSSPPRGSECIRFGGDQEMCRFDGAYIIARFDTGFDIDTHFAISDDGKTAERIASCTGHFICASPSFSSGKNLIHAALI